MSANEHKIFYSTVETVIGPLLLAATDKGLCWLNFGSDSSNLMQLTSWAKKMMGSVELVESADKLEEAKRQLTEYFVGERREFTLELDLYGTDFQKRVWSLLREIPYGEVRSYKEIAFGTGSPKAVRAVGGANHNNPISIIVPCHRVIGACGTLVGYGGGLDIKKFLLQLEGYLPREEQLS
jgi:O-6-methylguanine DNA methyltransferase